MSDPNVNTPEQDEPEQDEPEQGEPEQNEPTQDASEQNKPTQENEPAQANVPADNSTADTSSPADSTANTQPAADTATKTDTATTADTATITDTATTEPPVPPVPPAKDVVLNNAFMLGWGLVELKNRLQIALVKGEAGGPQSSEATTGQDGRAGDPDRYSDPGMRLASVWRSLFGRLAALHSKTFPTSATTDTLYEPPDKNALAYLHPPESDYANVGIIISKDKSGAPILPDFGLYDVTRRAINCLTLLYVDWEKSLIPKNILRYQNHLVAVILEDGQHPGRGGGDSQAAAAEQAAETAKTPDTAQTPAAEQPADPDGDTGQAELPGATTESTGEDRPVTSKRLQRARMVLTERTVKFLDAWDGFLRENYYLGGAIPNDDLELIAYEAGHSMSSLSWDIAQATAGLEQDAEAAARSQTETASAQPPDAKEEAPPPLPLETTDGKPTGGEETGTPEPAPSADTQPPDAEKKFTDAWKNVFRPQNVVRLQHQISSLSSALDDIYYLKHTELKRPAAETLLSMPNPDLPSQAIQAVKHSLDYWQRAVDWVPKHLAELRSEHSKAKDGKIDAKLVNPAKWS